MVNIKRSVRNIKLLIKKRSSSDNENSEKTSNSYLSYDTKKDKPKEKDRDKPSIKDGIDLKELSKIRRRFAISKEDDDEIKNIDMKYPLIIDDTTGKVMAYAHIKYDTSINKLVYEVIEPPLNINDIKNITYIKKIIENKINVDLGVMSAENMKKYIEDSVVNIIKQFGISASKDKIDIYKYYIVRDFLGLGKIEPLLRDKNIEDISCDGVNIPIFVFHRDPRISSVQTNVKFNKKEELDYFIIKLAQKCNKNISVAEPLLEGALPDGSRVHGVLGTDIARRGSNFTIRKFSKDPLTPIKLMQYHTIDAKTLAYLWLCIENKLSVLVSGPTAAGKTSLLNALSMFIRPDAKIVSIEDTPELRLQHPHWIPEVERPGFGSFRGDKRAGEVTMFDLLKGALRQRPDYIIVGEVRGKETYVLFQGMATGHAGLATMHADSMDKVIDRLITPPINLPPSLLETLDLITFVKGFRYKNSFVRRVTDIYEVERYNFDTKTVSTRQVVAWNSEKDVFDSVNPSIKLKKISSLSGLSKEEILIELKNRIFVLNWMLENKITDFVRVSEIIKTYYYDKDYLFDFIENM